jgi:murein L,D-transpeptidase YafK
MTNGSVDDIYRLVAAALAGGQPAVDVHAFPFRMTEANMMLHSGSRWMGFWRDLKRGYDMFENAREIPVAGVRNGRYVVFAANEAADLREARLISAWQ